MDIAGSPVRLMSEDLPKYEGRVMQHKYDIDFGKCENFDELCGLLNLCGFQFTGDESDPKWGPIQPYLGDMVLPITETVTGEYRPEDCGCKDGAEDVCVNVLCPRK